MRIIAIDPSLTSTGISTSRSTTRWVPPKGYKGSQRLWWFKIKMLAIIEEYRPDLIVMEGYAMGARGRVFSIGELGGVLRLTAYEKGVSMLIVPPTTLKMYTTGKGNANKEKMLETVNKRWGYLTFQNDEADAYALYKFGQSYVSRKFKRSAEGKKYIGKCEFIICD